ncbi:MAG: ABC transporter permease [Rhizobiaceae bacterium]|nr:ABC transporter permease [Rhizobiaceae bacterium]
MSAAETMIAPQPAPPEPPRRFTLARLAGIVFMALWMALFASVAITAIGDFDSEKFFKYGPAMLRGLVVTVELVATSLVLGAILSVPLAFARMSRSTVVGTLAYGYVYIFRGTPLIMQVFLIYYGLGSFRPQLDAIGTWWFFREAYNCALLAFTLNTAAYQAEILRGAIQSVPRGQWEASRALGLHPLPAFFRVILPQALMVALRPYGNEIILMIKGSAIVSIVTVFDLMGETRRAYSRTFDFQMYLWAAVLYLAIVELLRNVWNALERRLTRHLRR